MCLKREDVEGSKVFVLPNMTEATCIGPISFVTPQSVAFLKDYWKSHHGYDIPDACLVDQVKVKFAGSGRHLTYPTVCLWKYEWSHIPGYTKTHCKQMELRIGSEMASIQEMWRYELASSENTHSDEFVREPKRCKYFARTS